MENRKPEEMFELEKADEQRRQSLDELLRWIDLYLAGKELDDETTSINH